MKADYKGGIPPAARQERYNPYSSGVSPQGEPVCAYGCSAPEFKEKGYSKTGEQLLPEAGEKPSPESPTERPSPQAIWSPFFVPSND